ncbi:MAG TPA: sigma-E factor negative regulatory protein, partial [Steroidobacter sp.]|jgi:negative regulator of sigma E activity|nr:sigma-E factor negative regulatory protein [Steroidobacter sp.]
MSDPVKEQLSAYLDGELADAELDLLLKRLGRDPEFRGSLTRYALMSESLKGARAVVASNTFAAEVMAALADAPAVGGGRPRLAPPWARRLRPVAGLAVAASVAAVAVFSIEQSRVGPAVVADNEAASSAAQTVVDPEPSYIVPTTASTGAFVPAARLTNYVVAHSEYSSPLGRRTVLSGVLSEDDAGSEERSTSSADASDAQVTHP